MVNYHLEYIKATGKGKRESVIEFSKGINIIHGKSNSGKTVLANSIKFLMGGTVDYPKVLLLNGYNVITGSFVNERFHITLSRVYGDDKVQVITDDPFVDSGEYPIYEKDSPCDLNLIMLHLIGIDYVPLVASNERSDKKTMTWKAILHFLYLDKQRMTRDKDLWVDIKETQTYYP